ncbi:3-oxoacyl-reductase [Dactylonectria macrodidyma]|uniref:3-oxoacyl-reductase n=1 Tax=Dactylonectria macrodidyma TaxID=307937 RepID=A0A9P9IZI0_9HYPO|nr:3-oxoacyl-reductase [Dactylonectria macrodidyma]
MTPSDDSITQSLAGEVAVVSGSSSGIGAAIARELSLRGAAVVINYPAESERKNAENVLRSLKDSTKAVIVEADLSTTTGPTKLIKAAVTKFYRIDILVNNAGIGALCDLEEPDDITCLKSWDAVISLNARGTFLLARAVLKHLTPKHSRIINICSTTSRNPDPHMSMYAGSKGMMESFTRCWARDLPRKYGCTVNSVAPGPVATEMMLSAPPKFLDIIRNNTKDTPVASRMAEPSEVAWLVAMLCEEKAGWINGLYIPVAGGATLS